jgi:hypothetical protein
MVIFTIILRRKCRWCCIVFPFRETGGPIPAGFSFSALDAEEVVNAPPWVRLAGWAAGASSKEASGPVDGSSGPARLLSANYVNLDLDGNFHDNPPKEISMVLHRIPFSRSRRGYSRRFFFFRSGC